MLEKLRQEPAKLQVELNKVEAQHRSLFVAGWRPFIGWVCGLALFNYFLLNPWLMYLTGRSVPIKIDALFELVIAMLGMGTLRTIEKFGGKTK